MPSSPESDAPPAQPGRPPAPTTPAPPSQPASESDELTRERERADRLDDRYKRALADLENLRKRTPALIEQRLREGRDAMLLEWLEAVDSVERALRMQQPGGPSSAGMRAVLEQMEQILERQGVRRIGAVGEPFDPERHEAISVLPAADGQPDHAILDVARTGYERNDEVVRPAQVVVGRRVAPAS
jgi:molecular chaperone GrpE